MPTTRGRTRRGPAATAAALATLLLALPLLGGCQSPRDSDSLVVATKSRIDSLDPVQASRIGVMQVLSGIGDPLYAIDAGGRIQPRLSPDGLRARIPLRQGVLFHDGTRFDAAAMAFSLRRFMAIGTLGYQLSGIFTNALRLNLRRALGSDYVEAARSRGLSERRVVLHHALPNALLPVLTITGITVASLIGGALLIEVTFSWPGIAFRLQEAIAQRDYPVVQGIVVVVAALLDPRIRF